MMVRFDICCVVREVNTYHHRLVGYELTSLVATCGTSLHLFVVRVDMGTS